MSKTIAEIGVPIGTVVKVTKNGARYVAVTPEGEDIADKIESFTLKNAFRAQKAIQLDETKNGKAVWRQVEAVEYELAQRKGAVDAVDHLNIAPDVVGGMNHDALVAFIKDSYKLKPAKLIIDEDTWKFAIRNVLRGENILAVGPSGCGKTLLANALKVALGREETYFYVNLGAAQDARSTLIGNTHFNKETGTFVSLSYFAQAIQVPNALILLDEVSRDRSGEATNILMTVLDPTQRYLRVDERADAATIRVADGVSFILTANVGSEYTATRTMDRALLDRCLMVEILPLEKEQEIDNLTRKFPRVEKKWIDAIADIAGTTRKEVVSAAPQVDTIISTRMCERWAACIYDGLSFEAAVNKCVYPFFSDAGGADSPRSFVRKLVQKHLKAPDAKVQDTDEPKLPWATS